MILRIDRIEIGHVIVKKFEQDGADVSAALQATLQRLEGKVNQIMATQAEFQAKIDTINANTSASAAAAQALAANLTALREEIKNGGLSAEKEASILAMLDSSVSTSTALKTFLEETAAGPVTQPEPEPVPAPEPV